MTRYAPTPEEAEAQIQRAFRGDIAAAAERWTRRLDFDDDPFNESSEAPLEPLGVTRSGGHGGSRGPGERDATLETSEIPAEHITRSIVHDPIGDLDPTAAELVARQRRGVLEAGTRGLVKIAEGRSNALTDSEAFGLEAIVLLEGRPALLVQEDSFIVPQDSVWTEDLRRQRSSIELSLPKVGRVEVLHHPRYDWVGTAWLAGATTLLTNRHVANEFVDLSSSGEMVFRAPMSASVDFRQELTSVGKRDYQVVAVRGIHPDPNIDLAVLQIEPVSSRGHRLPDGLEIAAQPPADLLNRKVYVIGYPAFDSRNGFHAMREIFRDIYNVKRLQPGEIDAEERNRPVIHHDCSTLGGNSGSPVIDLETHQVLGLHFGGRFRQGNLALALWRLQDDPIFQGTDVRFV
ncbi:MAG: serine protease [Acidobacteriota bacterium]